MRIKRSAPGIVLLAAALGSGGLASAQPPSAEDAIGLRRGAYALQGHYFARLKPMVTGKAEFDAAVAETLIARVAALLPMAAELFPAGSDQGDTKARAAIWRNPDDFADRQAQAEAAIQALATAAPGGNDAAFKAAYFDAASACKQCHDDYRQR